MIANLWGQIDLVCGNIHTNGETDLPMLLDEVRLPLMYRCVTSTPKDSCLNVLSIADYQKMMEKLADILLEAETVNSVPNLKGMKWTNKGIVFKILSDKDGRFRISVFNKKAVSQEKPRLR